MTRPGERVQIDIKHVPAVCCVGDVKEQKLYSIPPSMSSPACGIWALIRRPAPTPRQISSERRLPTINARALMWNVSRPITDSSLPTVSALPHLNNLIRAYRRRVGNPPQAYPPLHSPSQRQGRAQPP